MNWITVKELAEYLKLSEVMIYKLAQKSEIPASKIGSAWRFSQSEIDEWLLGKQEKLSWLVDPANKAMDHFIKGCRKEFGDNLSAIIIFGSYARGDANKGSDLDVLVALKSIDDQSKMQKKIGKIAYNSTFDRDVPIVMAPILIDETEYLTGVSPLLMTVRKKGRKVF